MDFRVTSDGCLLFIMDSNYQIHYVIDTEDETLHIIKQNKDEDRQSIS